MNGAKQLPDGWEWLTIGDVSTSQSGAGFPKSYQGEIEGDYPFAKVSDITNAVKNNGGLLVSAANYLSSVTAKKIHAKEFPIGTTLFAKIGEAVGLNRRALVSVPVLADNNVMGLIPKKEFVIPKFLYHFMHTVDLYEYSQATTVPSVRKSDVEQISFPLPPLPEQERIVSRIEELFSDLEAGMASLERVRAGLKRYKASVLKAAISGKLVKGSLGIGEGELPDGWQWTTLEELSSDANYGTSQKCDYNENEFPVVRIPNIVSGNIDLSDLKFAIDGSGLRDQDSLTPGNLLIVRTNGSRDLIGKSALIRKPLEKQHYFASYLIRYRINDYENIGSWLSTIWDSPFIRAWLETVVSTTAGQYNLNIVKLNKLPIPLPPLDEQRRIVAEVERRLSVVGEVASAVEVGLVRAARLRQSVLRSAFEGRL